MKRLFNITTCDYDLARYAGADDLTRVLREYALDGLEVLPIGENSLGWIPPRMVPGIHLTYFNSWLDAYRGDAARVEAEYGSMEEAERQLGGPADGVLGFFTTDALSILFTLVILWIARRLDGVYEDQKHYLLRIQKEDKPHLQ